MNVQDNRFYGGGNYNRSDLNTVKHNDNAVHKLQNGHCISSNNNNNHDNVYGAIIMTKDGNEVCQLSMGWVGSTISKVLKFDRITLVHLKHGCITFGCIKQLNMTLRPIWQVPETGQKELQSYNVSQWQLDHNDTDLEVLDICVLLCIKIRHY